MIELERYGVKVSVEVGDSFLRIVEPAVPDTPVRPVPAHATRQLLSPQTSSRGAQATTGTLPDPIIHRAVEELVEELSQQYLNRAEERVKTAITLTMNEINEALTPGRLSLKKVLEMYGCRPDEACTVHYVTIVPEIGLAILVIPGSADIAEFVKDPLKYFVRERKYLRDLHAALKKLDRLKKSREDPLLRISRAREIISSLGIPQDLEGLPEVPYTERGVAAVTCEVEWTCVDNQMFPPSSSQFNRVLEIAPSGKIGAPVIMEVHEVRYLAGRRLGEEDVQKAQEALAVLTTEAALSAVAWADASMHPNAVRSLLGSVRPGRPDWVMEYLPHLMKTQLEIIGKAKIVGIPYLIDYLIDAGALMLAEAAGHEVQITGKVIELCEYIFQHDPPVIPSTEQILRTFDGPVTVAGEKYEPYMYRNLTIAALLTAAINDYPDVILKIAEKAPDVWMEFMKLSKYCRPIREAVTAYMGAVNV